MREQDISRLIQFQKLNPSCFLCIEGRPLQESKSISACVIVDIEYNTNIVVVNVDLSWLGDTMVHKITPIMGVTQEHAQPPILIVHDDAIHEINHESVAQILLTSAEGITTHITFPWLRDNYWMLGNANRWIFVSLDNLLDDTKDLFHWGFGDFGNVDSYNQYFYSRINFGA